MPQMAADFFHIRTKGEGILPLVPRPVQLHFHKTRGRRTVMPKYRQGGLSTWQECEGLLLLLDPALAGFSGVIISHERGATERLLSIVELAYDELPDRDAHPMKRESLHEFASEHGSRLYIGTAGARAFGRGDTVHWAHCSEVAHWENAERIMLGLAQAIPPKGYITVESSPFGRQGWFFETYRKAREGIGSYTPVFLPWFWSREEYRDPVPDGFGELTAEEANVMEAAARMGLALDLGNITWRRRQIADMGPTLFAQEYPEDDETCFLVSGRPYFEPAFVNLLINQAEARPVLETRYLSGGEIKVWEKPGVGHSYVIGIDPSEGKAHGDACAGVVENCDTGQHVATIWGRIPPYEFARLCNNLSKEYYDALLAPEGGTASGQSFITFLTESLKCKRVYRNEKRATWTDDDLLTYELGFRTTSRSKRYLCDEFDRAIRCGDFRTWDTKLLGQAFDVLVNDMGEIRTATDREDDILMAAMIANVAVEQATKRTSSITVGSYL